MEKKFILRSLLVLVGLTSLASCGGSSFDLTKSISVTTREDGSGTKSAFMEIIGLKGKSDVSNAIIATGTAAVLQEVKGNPYAIAYESLGYVTSDVKKLQVNGVDATVENIKANKYKIARPLNVIYKEDTVKNSTLFTNYLTYLQSKQAYEIISENGYVSTLDSPKEYTINGDLKGSIKISGSTSLQPLMIKLAAKFEELQKNCTVEVSGGGSGTGYSNGENGVSDFGMISEEFKSTKAPSCTYYTVAKDGIAIIVNSSNSVNTITLDEVKNIYNLEQDSASKISTWKQLAN